jgi:His/Glu/Gln/Arg/opine family amino acid ABC transporter permease subunit
MYELRFEVLLRYIDPLIEGILIAIGISLASILFGAIIGMFIALARTSNNSALRFFAAAYVQIIRNIPLLLILIFIYFVLPILGIRGIDKFQSAIAALSIYAAAYLSEIFRAGIEAVSTRYVEAAKSIGLSKYQIFVWVTFPIMIGEVLPAVSNNVISLFKDSSLAAAISVPEITFVGRQINIDTFRVIEAWTVVGATYITVAVIASQLLRRLEVTLVRWR